VTFNNHGGSTKSFEFVRDHEHTVTGADYVPHRDEITADYAEGSVLDVTLHDESRVRLRKLDATYDPSDRAAALQYMMEHQAKDEVVTGLLYLNTGDDELKEKMDVTAAPLNSLGAAELRPDMATLEKINAGLR
jgi:2-oxoglutarate ferredoxin oxidoreductase subunit beta